MIWPVETPIVSPCAIERENMRTPGVSTRASRFSSASTSVRPMFCSCRVSRTSEESGSRIFVAERRSDCGKLRPASSVTTRRSIRSGSPRSICSRRFLARESTTNIGSDPAEHGRADGGEEQQRRAAAGERGEPERDERAGDGAEKLRAEEPLGRRVVHPGRHEPGAVVLAPKAAEPLAQVATRRCREVVQARRRARALVVVRGRERACEAVGADLLDGLRGRAGRGDERPDDHRDGDREKEEPDDENEEVRHLRARS